ncbi:uncharacterized protein BYT42DRAFT_555837 [Radiomyces spectabilis]|uniref:uncharacterized protein n=1 Tax=Radiomyces spectabilis TaxID=64574 RepID=UPI00221F8AD2|nr:uncharacterized protein BYT42DRAFT_555837 [Radiomyces spectabilis]KAI8391160.1 hypothetical protein BYT42DRAFT_555837 [Radiomyces spectabilis]
MIRITPLTPWQFLFRHLNFNHELLMTASCLWARTFPSTHNFQLAVKANIDQGPMNLTLKENVQHILALSSILLLKPCRTHEDHEFIDLHTCERLQAHIVTTDFNTRHLNFPQRDQIFGGEYCKTNSCLGVLGKMHAPKMTGQRTR